MAHKSDSDEREIFAIKVDTSSDEWSECNDESTLDTSRGLLNINGDRVPIEKVICIGNSNSNNTSPASTVWSWNESPISNVGEHVRWEKKPKYSMLRPHDNDLSTASTDVSSNGEITASWIDASGEGAASNGDSKVSADEPQSVVFETLPARKTAFPSRSFVSLIGGFLLLVILPMLIRTVRIYQNDQRAPLPRSLSEIWQQESMNLVDALLRAGNVGTLKQVQSKQEPDYVVPRIIDSVLFLVISSPGNLEKREAIRRTWAQDWRLRVKFVVGNPDEDSMESTGNSSLEEEAPILTKGGWMSDLNPFEYDMANLKADLELANNRITHGEKLHQEQLEALQKEANAIAMDAKYFHNAKTAITTPAVELLEKEQHQHHDLIILNDVVDTYTNLRMKVMGVIHYILEDTDDEFSQIKWSVKLDDDVYVRPNLVLEALEDLEKRYDPRETPVLAGAVFGAHSTKIRDPILYDDSPFASGFFMHIYIALSNVFSRLFRTAFPKFMEMIFGRLARNKPKRSKERSIGAYSENRFVDAANDSKDVVIKLNTPTEVTVDNAVYSIYISDMIMPLKTGKWADRNFHDCPYWFCTYLHYNDDGDIVFSTDSSRRNHESVFLYPPFPQGAAGYVMSTKLMGQMREQYKPALSNNLLPVNEDVATGYLASKISKVIYSPLRFWTASDCYDKSFAVLGHNFQKDDMLKCWSWEN